MQPESLSLKNNERVRIRFLQPEDAESLGAYFEELSEETRKRFGPHPLTSEYAQSLCHQVYREREKKTYRFVGQRETSRKIVAYMIINFHLTVHEVERYQQQGIAPTAMARS